MIHTAINKTIASVAFGLLLIFIALAPNVRVTAADARFTADAQEHVSFETSDGGVVYADVYGIGGRGVVLAHGGRFNKESWAPQARELAAAGFHVVAIDFRGYGPNSRASPSRSS